MKNKVVHIDMGKLSRESGKSEVELAKTIITVLAIKAEVAGITQHVTLSFPKENSCKAQST